GRGVALEGGGDAVGGRFAVGGNRADLIIGDQRVHPIRVALALRIETDVLVVVLGGPGAVEFAVTHVVSLVVLGQRIGASGVEGQHRVDARAVSARQRAAESDGEALLVEGRRTLRGSALGHHSRSSHGRGGVGGDGGLGGFWFA